MIPNNFTQIIEKDGKTYLFDGDSFGYRSLRVGDITKAYQGAANLLERFDYPKTEEWITAITGGSRALRKAVLKDTDENAARVGVPRFIADAWRQSALDALPQEMEDRADEIAAALTKACDGIPLKQGDVSFDENGPRVDEDGIKTRLFDAFLVEVTPEMKKEAGELSDIVARIRKLEEGGLNAIELCKSLAGSYLAPSKYPDLLPSALYRLVCTRRHVSKEEVKANNPVMYAALGGE